MNIIATCAMHFEGRAKEELLGILENLGDPDASVEITGYTGLLTGETALDPVDAVARIREMVLDEPWSVRYCLRFAPVQRCVPASNDAVIGEAGFISEMIPDEKTYKIFVKKRGSKVSGTEIIRGLASRIPNPVRMERPDREVIIEIIGSMAGISVLGEGGVLRIHEAKRSQQGGALG